MKLVFAIVHPKDADSCVSGLTSAGFVCTRYSSYGGFLEKDNVTLLTCVDDGLVDGVIEVLRKRGRRRHEEVSAASVGSSPAAGGPATIFGAAVDVEVGGATVFVIDAERFEKL
jgi:uncharacterized protein YaaQ